LGHRVAPIYLRVLRNETPTYYLIRLLHNLACVNAITLCFLSLVSPFSLPHTNKAPLHYCKPSFIVYPKESAIYKSGLHDWNVFFDQWYPIIQSNKLDFNQNLQDIEWSFRLLYTNGVLTVKSKKID
jgi:hypothetical protein